MNSQEASQIFKGWQQFVEINDKLGAIFPSIPESFLPYPVEIIEEALNIVAEDYFNAGENEIAASIQNSIATLLRYEGDVEALESIFNKLKIMLSKPELKEAYLERLKQTTESWAQSKRR